MLSNYLRDQSIQNRDSKLIYQDIYQYGPISRASLIHKTGLDRNKVARSLKELLSREYIQETGFEEAERGRPPVLYRINPACHYLVGVHITRTETKIALFDLLFKKINQRSIVMTSEHTPEVVIEQIIHTIHEFLNENHLHTNDLLGIGIGAIGPLDREKGIIVSPGLFLAPGWENVRIVERIKEAFPVETMLENGANVAALGEYKYNEDSQNLLNVVVGWAWGCGVILNGELLRVENGDVSNYGHTVIHVDGKMCTCGKNGCALAYTSLQSILDEIKKLSPDFFHKKFNSARGYSLDEIMSVFLERDERTEKIILNSAKYVGITVANIASLFHSKRIVLNGPLLQQYPGYYEKVIEYTSSHITGHSKVQFSKGNFEEGSAVVGAAIKVFESFF